MSAGFADEHRVYISDLLAPSPNLFAVAKDGSGSTLLDTAEHAVGNNLYTWSDQIVAGAMTVVDNVCRYRIVAMPRHGGEVRVIVDRACSRSRRTTRHLRARR